MERSSLRLQQILLSVSLGCVALTLGGDRSGLARLISWSSVQVAAVHSGQWFRSGAADGDPGSIQAKESASSSQVLVRLQPQLLDRASVARAAVSTAMPDRLSDELSYELNDELSDTSGLFAPRPSSQGLADAVEVAQRSVVQIESNRAVRGEGGSLESGSGVIVDEQGIILTNAHVVGSASQVMVTLWDDTQQVGQVLGKDERLDLAVVQVTADALPPIAMADSDRVRPGEWAIAIGSPLGLENTATVGIVSAVGRSSAEARTHYHRGPFIQTDAAINPGNSGGALLNEAGQLIGINTAVLGGTQGIGFAIPMNMAQDFLAQVLAESDRSQATHRSRAIPEPMPNARSSGSGERMSGSGGSGHAAASPSPAIRVAPDVEIATDLTPRLGIYGAFPPEAVAAVNHDPESLEDPTWGVLVIEVLPHSPAAHVGLQVGDIIMAVDGNRVTTPNALRLRLNRVSQRRAPALDVLRNQQRLTLTPSLATHGLSPS